MRGFANPWRLASTLAIVLTIVSSPETWAQPPATPAPSKFEMATAGAKKVEGLWTIYFKEQQVLVDLKSGQLQQDFLMLTSIAKGASTGMVIGGMTWGDDVLWSFRKVGDKVHVLRRNVKFKARPGSPESNAVKIAYSDSVLYALPIVADTPGGQLVDMTRIFFSDDEQIGAGLGMDLQGRFNGRGAMFAMDRSTVGKVKAFPKNVEIEIDAVYVTDRPIDTVADPRGIPVTVHYSISQLPQTGYRPRKADDRIGYFLTVTKDFSDFSDDQNFVRYINRWDLQKADPSAKLSPPREPIVFYLEKTLPINLRPIVRSGIEEWNKAFEKLGFANAVEVRQQRDDDDWDPEDVRYNTFRWITAEAGFAMGPSRVNPTTGQILDADIIFDASFLRSWKSEYENFNQAQIAEIFGDFAGMMQAGQPANAGQRRLDQCQLSAGMHHQVGFAAASFLAMGPNAKRVELPEEFLQQALKEVVMHEVGHTLGLRHNFKASAWKTLAEIDDPAKAQEPTVASVMDYSPVNIAPAGSKQGLYYTNTLGPYDVWAIEYGYKVVDGNEPAELAKIAARSGEPGLDFSTDEDTRGTNDPDPLSNRFDLGKDPVAYAQRQMATAVALIPKLLERSVEAGEGYQRVRQAFGIMLREYFRSASFAARLPGGVYVHRDHKGDNQGRAPFKQVEAAQQRAAMKLLLETALSSPKYDPNLLNSLSSTRWYQWGMSLPNRIEYPITDTVSLLQARLLNQLLSSLVLERLQDGELRVAEGEDVYTLAEHLKTVVDAVFVELAAPPAAEFNNRNPYVPTFRRAIQRHAVRHLTTMVLQPSAPEDARVLSRLHLSELAKRIDAALTKADLKLDEYTLAHFNDLRERIRLTLDRSISVPQN